MTAGTKLVPSKIKLAGENNTLRIEWSDGHVSAYPYQYLRDRCPCATCLDSKPAATAPSGALGALPMFKKALRPARAELLGRYAVQIHWNDGHATGIYTFDYLRELCPCAECESTARAARRER